MVTAWNRDSRERMLVMGQEEAEPTFSAARATLAPTDETR
jgi:hypothetical protein